MCPGQSHSGGQLHGAGKQKHRLHPPLVHQSQPNLRYPVKILSSQTSGVVAQVQEHKGSEYSSRCQMKTAQRATNRIDAGRGNGGRFHVDPSCCIRYRMVVSPVAKVNSETYGDKTMSNQKASASAAHETTSRLQPSDWIWAGFRALVRGGPQALRVEPIARELGTTKGSFYWHFTDVAALRAAMLETWEQVATADITAAVRQSGLPPRDQVLLLVEKVSVTPGSESGGEAIEPAIRDWGRTDPMAREVLKRVDRQRLADLKSFFGAAGLASTAAKQASALFYAAVIGLESLRLTAGISMREPLRALAQRLMASL